MDTLLTIVVLLVVIFIGKFIYDTYLTDNTERDFDEYRKSDPIGAAKIELPKTQEQFKDLVNAVDDDLFIKVKDLSDLFPELIKNLTKMKVTTDTPFKLELESVGGEMRVFMTINQNLEDLQFYFHVTMMDKDSDIFSSDKICLGRRATVVATKPDWNKLIHTASKNVALKQTRHKFEKLVTEEQKKLSLKFDGYYCITNIDGSGATQVLRFYPDGVVIHVKLMGDPYTINSWFKRDSEKVLQGKYTLTNGLLDINVSNPQRGYSYFIGYIKDDRHVFLQVNGKHEVGFGFIHVDENKVYEPKKKRSSDNEFEHDFDM